MVQAVPPGSIASVFGNNFQYQNLREGLAGLPQAIGIFATFDPAKTAVVPNVPVRVFSPVEAGEKFGFGFPAHLAARQTLLKSGIVPVFIFPNNETGTASDGDILFSVTSTSAGTLSIYIGGQRVPVTVPDASTPAEVATLVAAALIAAINLPVNAVVNGGVPEQVDITAKYKGLIGDDIGIAINIEEAELDARPGGTTAVITALSSGVGTPVITTAVAKMGDDWYTWVVNTFGTDSTTLAAFATYNEDNRWDPLVNKFFRAVYGSVDDLATITAITDALPLDRTNQVVTSPAGYMLPLEAAALGVGQMAASNQDNPARPYTSLPLSGLKSAVSASQWTYTQRNAAILAGTGTTVVIDNVIELEDMAMHYHKTGEDPPAYRWSVDIAKLAEWAYNVNLIFKGPNWRGKILVADTDVVRNPDARKPKDALGEIYKLADAAASGTRSIITRPEVTKTNSTASIDESNPNRLNISTLIVLSGATRVISLTSNFGFNFGAIAA